MMTKRSKNPRWDDPSAFSKRFPRIEPLDASMLMERRLGVVEEAYKMGALRCTVTRPQDKLHGYFMSVHGRDKYPLWDEVVWLRYSLIPDAAVMVMVLPNLNAYINVEDTAFKYVFTLEQREWRLEPIPRCETDGVELSMVEIGTSIATFRCPVCGAESEIDLTTWNEVHGNGFLAKNGVAT